MRWHYNLCNLGGGPLVRDLDIYAVSGLVAGEAVIAIAGANQSCLQAPSGATVPDFVGVLAETPSSQASVMTTGTLYQAKTIINPDAIYITQYDPSTSTDVDVVSSTSAAVTIGTADDNLDGGWIYVNSGTGVGQLAFIGAASTTVLTLDTTNAFGVTPDSTSDILLLRPAWALNTNLDSTYTMIDSSEQATGLIMTLGNYIESATVPFGPLRPRQHHMKSGLNTDGVKFYADVRFIDNIFNKVVVFTS